MSCSARENCNIFWRLFTFRIYKNWKHKYQIAYHGKSLFRLNWWRWNYKNVWHDSIGKFFNRLIKCQITNHKNTQDIACDGELPRTYCFDCEKYIEQEMMLDENGNRSIFDDVDQ